MVMVTTSSNPSHTLFKNCTLTHLDNRSFIGCVLHGSYLSSERALVRPVAHWGPLRSRLQELRGASWEVRGCGELCWERERSERGCCCSSDGVPHDDCCQWRPEAPQGSWGPSSRTHMGKGISCTWGGRHDKGRNKYIRSKKNTFTWHVSVCQSKKMRDLMLNSETMPFLNVSRDLKFRIKLL